MPLQSASTGNEQWPRSLPCTRTSAARDVQDPDLGVSASLAGSRERPLAIDTRHRITTIGTNARQRDLALEPGQQLTEMCTPHQEAAAVCRAVNRLKSSAVRTCIAAARAVIALQVAEPDCLVRSDSADTVTVTVALDADPTASYLVGDSICMALSLNNATRVRASIHGSGI